MSSYFFVSISATQPHKIKKNKKVVGAMADTDSAKLLFEAAGCEYVTKGAHMGAW